MSGAWFGDWLVRILRGATQRDIPLAERVERVVLGDRRRYTRAEVSERSGVPLERCQRLWRALGFADVGADDVVFTDGDVDAVRLVDSLVSSGLLDLSTEAAVARAVGYSQSRLAEWEIGLLGDFLYARAGAKSDDESEHGVDDETVVQFAENIIPLMEQLHSYVWRRHLVAYSGRALAAEAGELEPQFKAVGFADVVGYTQMTRQLSEPELARLVERFEAMSTEVVAGGHGRVVKMLGDEVLFVADDAQDAASIACALHDRAREEGLPDLRIGVAAGTVLSRFGDVYGSVVNVASRLTSTARPGTIVVDRELAARLGDDPAWRLRRRRSRNVPGYHLLASWELTRTTQRRK